MTAVTSRRVRTDPARVPPGGGTAVRSPAPERPAPDLPPPRSLHPIVTLERPSGPVFAGRRARVRRLRRGTFAWAMRPVWRIALALLTLGWLATLVWFWRWWLSPEHVASWPATVVNSTLLGWLCLQPAVFLFTVNRMREVHPGLPVAPLRVAFVVTKAPSEPWDVARTTLQAMLDQSYPYPYDVWLCDEDPAPQTLDWCHEHGVWVSTRKDQPAYHQAHWPRRTRCKEGNLAWFYDNWGYRAYDVVSQLDCDHVPTRRYLQEMVRAFADPSIGYVAAPSVCDTNAPESWSARGRLHREATFHGPFQAGHNAGLAPVCIGSHYAVRTAAVRQIGGIGPELAEDFSTAFLLASAGWQGAFAHRAHASGDGPLSFAAMITQEFQWSRSMVAVLLELAPRHLRRMHLGLRLRFLYTLSFFPGQAILPPLGLALTAAAAIFGFAWVHVHYLDFVLHWAALSAWLVAVAGVLRFSNLLRPRSSPLLSWEGGLYVLTRWVWISWGAIAAVRQVATGRRTGFAVTPKAREGLEPFAVRLVRPYLLISLAMTAAAVTGAHLQLGRPGSAAPGYITLSLITATAYALAAVLVPVLHARETGRAAGVRTGAALRRTGLLPFLLGLLAWVPLVPALVAYRHVLLMILL